VRWDERAACADMGNRRFYRQPSFRSAQETCSGCSVRETCLNVAMSWEAVGGGRFRYGVWGGLTPSQRTELALTDPRYAVPHEPTILEVERRFEEMSMTRIVTFNVSADGYQVGEDAELEDELASAFIECGYVTAIDGRDDEDRLEAEC